MSSEEGTLFRRGCDVPKPFTTAKIHYDGDYPTVSEQYRCGHVRLFVFWLCDKLITELPLTTRDRELRAFCLRSFCQYVLQMRQCKTVMGREEQLKAHHHGQMFLLSLQWLAHRNQVLGLKRYLLRPKAHWCFHMIQSLQREAMNPRFFETWNDEDLTPHFQT